MAYYSVNEIRESLEKFPQFKDKLFCRGRLRKCGAESDGYGSAADDAAGFYQ